MGGVAEDHGAVLVAPSGGAQGGESAGRVVSELVGEVGGERGEVGEVLGEERVDVATAIEVRERGRWGEQGDGEIAAGVREGDEHELTSWPDVQGVAVELMLAGRSRRQGEFLVVVVEPVGVPDTGTGAGDRGPHR